MALFPNINTKVETTSHNQQKVTHRTWVRVFNEYENSYLQVLVEFSNIFDTNVSIIDYTRFLNRFVAYAYNTIHLYQSVKNWDKINMEGILIKKCPLNLSEKNRIIATETFKNHPNLLN